MATVLKFRRSSTDCVLTAAANAGLRSQRWYPKMAEILYRRIPPYLVEEIDVLADRDTDDNLAATMQALDQMRWWADMFRVDRTVIEPVWMHAKMANETGERRAYVRKLTGSWKSEQVDIAGHPAESMAVLRIECERHPYWEKSSLSTADTAASSGNVCSMSYDYTAGCGDVPGDVPARSYLTAAKDPVGEAWIPDRIWAGIRSSKYGTCTNFVKDWECEDGDATAGTDCSAPTTDATAQPGGAGNTKREVDFATTPDWAKRLTIGLEDVTANYADNIGRMLWLFRCKVDSSTECEVQFRFGFKDMADADFVRGLLVSVTNTDWDIQEMGECQVAPTILQHKIFAGGAFSPRKFAIQVWARRTSGSGSLHMDCIYPIPVDEGWLVVKGLGIVNTATDSLIYLQTPDDRDVAWCGSTVGIVNIPEWSSGSFRYPPGDGRIIAVFARATTSDIADDLSMTAKWVPRWANLRGGE